MQLCGIAFFNTMKFKLLHKVLKEGTKVHQVKNKNMNENELSQKIIGYAIEVHKQLGPGLLESAYQECLFYELRLIGLMVQKEKPMPIVYKEVKLDHGCRIDLSVEEKMICKNDEICSTRYAFINLPTLKRVSDYKNPFQFHRQSWLSR